MTKTKLVCPKGYDEAKFTLICHLFVTLDTDANRAIGVHEMTSFVKYFYDRDNTEKNQAIRDLDNSQKEQVDQTKGSHDEKISKYTEKCHNKNKEMVLTKVQKEKVNKMETTRDMEINKVNHKYADQKVKVTKEIELVAVLDPQEQAKKLIEDMNGSRGAKEVEFKKFFEYLRDRDLSGFEQLLKSE